MTCQIWSNTHLEPSLGSSDPGAGQKMVRLFTKYFEIFQDAHLSFLSGHASLSFYAMCFTIIYIQRRLTNRQVSFIPVLWIRIRMDPEILPGSGSVIIVPDPDPAKSVIADK